MMLYNVLLLCAGLLLGALYMLGNRVFYTAWEKQLHGVVYRRSVEGGLLRSLLLRHVLRGRFGALLEKELLVFARHVGSFSKGMFLFGILLSYLFLLYFVDKSELSMVWIARIVALTFGIVGYLFATLSLYFVFPALSTEGRSLWIVKTLPLPRWMLFVSKGLFWLVGSVVFALVAGYLVLSSFGFAQSFLWLLVFLMVMQTVVVIVIAFALGMTYPVYDEENVELISTSIPGIVSTLLQLGFVGWFGWMIWELTEGYLFVSLVHVSTVWWLVGVSSVGAVGLVVFSYRRFLARF
jgi:hypothetical protein